MSNQAHYELEDALIKQIQMFAGGNPEQLAKHLAQFIKAAPVETVRLLSEFIPQ